MRLPGTLALAILVACSKSDENRGPEQGKTPVSAAGKVPQRKDLRGRWLYHGKDATVVFEFSDTKVTIVGDAGDLAEYIIVGDTVILLGGSGTSFLYRGDSLLLQGTCAVQRESGEEELGPCNKVWRRMPR
jgi:hypothetical protein